MYLECKGGATGRLEAETVNGEATVRPCVLVAGNQSGQAGGGRWPQEACNRHPSTGPRPPLRLWSGQGRAAQQGPARSRSSRFDDGRAAQQS